MGFPDSGIEWGAMVSMLPPETYQDLLLSPLNSLLNICLEGVFLNGTK